VYTNGTPADVEVDIPADGHLLVLVGRTGIVVQTTDVDESPPEDISSVAVQLRVSGTEPVRMYIDLDRYTINAGAQLDLDLAPGKHKVSVRNGDGTVVWAHGFLTIEGADTIVIQIGEGRLPEVSGEGRFTSGG
jgi:hypothetical protein